MDGISASLVYALGALAVGSGLVISTDEDLVDLAYLYYNYMVTQEQMAWDGLEALNEEWNNSVTIGGTQDKPILNIPSTWVENIKSFFDFAFGTVTPTVSAKTLGDYGIPYSYTCMHDISVGMDPIIIPFDKFTTEVNMYKSGTNSYLTVNFIDNATNQTILYGDDQFQMLISVFSGSAGLKEYTNFLGWDVIERVGDEEGEIELYLKGTFLRYGTETIYHGCTLDNWFNGEGTNTVSIPYEGTYDWDGNVNDKVGEDGRLEVPLIPPDVWTGDGVTPDDIWNPSTDIPSDGTISIPNVDNPSIDIEGDITIPEDLPLDTPIDTPIDTPTTPEIPPIVPIIPDTPEVPDLDTGEDGNIDEDITDNWSNSNSGGLYYYYIGTDVADSGIDDVIGHATGVVSLSYTPYLWYNDCNITKIPYDSERFGKPSTFSNFYVYRINNVTRPVKKVGGFTAYDDSFSVDIGEGRPYSYMNETKLYQYPYSFAYVYDGINQPMEVKYHYLSHVYNDIYIKQTVSDKCTYGIFIRDYKGDAEGNLESVVLTSGNELPCSSSTYAQWFATNRNQINQNVQNVLATNAIQSHGAKQQFEINKDMNTINMIGGLGTALAGLFTMNIGGVGTGLMNAFNTTNMLKSQQATLNTQLALNKQSDQNAIQSAMALNNDMRNAPPTLISHGSNVFYGILNTDRKLLLIRMGLSEVDMYRIGTYFTMYGYKQNKVMDINLRSRKYFNYFKITAPNIVSYSVPHSQLDAIKEIFKNGITLWHYNNSDKVLNYFHSDNYEV